MQRLQFSSAISLAWLFAAGFLTVFLVSVPTASSGTAEYLPICTLPKCLNPQVTTKSGIVTANATAETKVHPEDAAKWCATYKPRDKYCPKEQVKTAGSVLEVSIEPARTAWPVA